MLNNTLTLQSCTIKSCIIKHETSTSSYMQVESSSYYWPSKMRGVEDSDDSASKKKIWNSCKRKQKKIVLSRDKIETEAEE